MVIFLLVWGTGRPVRHFLIPVASLDKDTRYYVWLFRYRTRFPVSGAALQTDGLGDPKFPADWQVATRTKP